MDALIAKADAAEVRQPRHKKRKTSHDETRDSIKKHSRVPKSLNDDAPLDVPRHRHIPNKKLRKELTHQATQAARARTLVEDAAMLLAGDAGLLQAENDLERSWRVGQAEIETEAGAEASRGRKEWYLDGGPYRCRYSRNGRHLAIAGSLGHVSTFDWQTGTMHSELQLQETCRDITFLHDHSHFAVAQKKYVFIYDRDGVELHCLKAHIEPTRLEFLPFHWLLASVGNAGYLKYQDTSTGQLLVEQRTKFGACQVMTQNAHNAVIHLGHQNGRVTLWTPNMPNPAVQVLAHLGPVASVSIDPSSGGATWGQLVGTEMSKFGIVGTGEARSENGQLGVVLLNWSTANVEPLLLQQEARSINLTKQVYTAPTIQQPFLGHVQPPLYLTHLIPQRPLVGVRFAPFQDVLTIGHNSGLTNLIVPGVGEPNFDSGEANPFENRKGRQEKEVRALLDKLPSDMISLDPEFIGSLASETKDTLVSTMTGGNPTPFSRLSRIDRLRASGHADETDTLDPDDLEFKGTREEKERKKMRGKGKSLSRYLRKQRKNVIDPTAVAIRAKLDRQRTEKKVIEDPQFVPRKPSALDRFTSNQ
ncbi:unnamed protein product [Mycena citricolor]|uniref:U three protein 7 n=1 Tax=Mycena citricolor TaxID=2018698 RepID=A0AAD2HFZ2_9AGAR|nr:unnamed protein product [Mycena citricolor]